MVGKGFVKSLVIVAVALVSVGGCAAPKRTYQPAQDHNTLSKIAFVHHLGTLPTVSMDEAYHAMLLLAREADSPTSFEERQAFLVRRGVVRAAWGLEADDVLDKGTLAYMIVKICGVPGGLNDAMFGSWGLGDRRYALRNAVWHDLIPYGMPYHVVTGGEMLTAITKAAEYMDRQDSDGAS